MKLSLYFCTVYSACREGQSESVSTFRKSLAMVKERNRFIARSIESTTNPRDGNHMHPVLNLAMNNRVVLCGRLSRGVLLFRLRLGSTKE